MPPIHYEQIDLPEEYPFEAREWNLPPKYDMNGSMHWHDCYEVSAILKGTGYYEVEREQYPVAPGDIVIMNRVEPHRVVVEDEGLEQIVLTFHSKLLYNGMSHAEDLSYLSPFLNRGANFENLISSESPYSQMILQKIQAINLEYKLRESGWKQMIKAELMAVLTLLSRHFGDKVENNQMKQQLTKLQPVFRYVDQHYGETIRLQDCADQVSFTQQYFSYYFKQITGMRFIDYLTSVRIHHAAELIHSTESPITEIAEKCGYNNMGNFSTMFKKIIGMSPSDFRRKNRI